MRSVRLRCESFCICLVATALMPTMAAGFPLVPGDILISPTIYISCAASRPILVNPVTGAQQRLESMPPPTSVAFAPNGDLFLTDGDVQRIDPATGLVLQTYQGGNLHSPYGISVSPNGEVYVMDSTANICFDAENLTLVRIDPVSGQQTLVTSFVSTLVVDTAVEPTGDILVLDLSTGVIRVDATTGDQQLLASITSPFGITVEDTGQALVAGEALVRVDPVSGSQSTVWSDEFSLAVAVEPSENIVVFEANGALIRVAPSGAFSSVISSGGFLPDLVGFVDLAIMPGTAPDADSDGIRDDSDNCPNIANFDQSDLDGDSVGDVCDNCPQVANSIQTDNDADGIGDLCDACTTTAWTNPPTNPPDQNPIKSQVRVTHLSRGPGEQRILAKGFTNPATFPSSGLEAIGLHLAIEDSDGLLYEANVPPGLVGALQCGSRDGWRVSTTNSGRTTSRYTNRTGAFPPGCLPGSAQGVTSIVVKDLTTTNKQSFQYIVKTKDHSLLRVPTLPLNLVQFDISLGAQTTPGEATPEAIEGQCAESKFEGDPIPSSSPKPFCKVRTRSGELDRIDCKGQ